MSGARIKPIDSDAARTFLERLGETGGTTALLQRAWGAFEDETALIGPRQLASMPTSPWCPNAGASTLATISWAGSSMKPRRGA
jgi:hypothetical protein